MIDSVSLVIEVVGKDVGWVQKHILIEMTLR